MILQPMPRSLKLAARSRVKVCVVDADFADYTHLLADRTLRGIEWEFISSGSEALHQLQNDKFSLWLINTRLPDIKGAELCQMIKSQSPTAVVYLLTDEYRAEDERAAWLAGAALFRPKPINPAWFEHIAKRCVHTKAA